MLRAAFEYPLTGREGRDALAAATALVLVCLLLVRATAALWPAVSALVALAAVAAPVVVLAGYLAAVLRASLASTGDGPPAFSLSLPAVRGGLRLLAVAVVYLSPAVAALLVTGAILLAAIEAPGSSPLVAIAPTLALAVVVACGYLLPGGLAAGAAGGLQAALSRGAVAGLADGAYFYAWTAAVATFVAAWSLPGLAGLRSPLAVPGAALAAYGTVVAVRLLGVGLARSDWTAP